MRKLSLPLAMLATTALTAPAFADDHLKIVDEPLELTIHMHWPRAQGYGVGGDASQIYPVEEAAREMTGIHLVDQTFGKNTKDSAESMNLLIASGDMPDIVGGHLIKQPVNEFGPQGAFVPLNDLVEEHAPNIKAFWDSHPGLKEAISAYDGNYYYIPYLPDGKYGRAYFIRQDWLDKLGLEQPNTVDELYDVLVAFRDQDPNGNGMKDEVPAFFRDWEEVIRLVVLWDGRSSGSDTYHDFLVNDEGKLEHPYAQEAYRDGLAMVAKWYEEGLIDPEVFTRGSSAREYLLSEDLGGFTHDWFASTSGYNAALADKVEGFNFIPFLPPESPSGRRLEEHRRIPIKPDGWAISHQNENPVETIKYFDFWFTEEGRLLSNFGIEGETYDMVDGEPIYKDEVLNKGEPVNAQMWAVGSQIQRGYWQDYRYEWQWTAEAARKGIELYDQHDILTDQFLGVAFTKEEQEVYDKYWPSLRTYMLERQQAWVLGTGDITAEWDDYVATLNKMGYEDVIEVLNSAYARQYG
ncbi:MULTISPECIES: extracellular solute-binding protein [Halocynthiibacter]|uniref:Extracellular solute-binding protein n=1 Tax=Halocynthiibacter halioticoli TaxID=2986804 RepID=A0AAE3LQX4_9RHOB|nr:MULTISPECIES: extracellular solute-binding protein [Halocynthiibacter]MCV6824008.1 extracellular solute-binding protein [Halocynthiibacter halioticoli]MCW4057009.1 extracellular solute-binding protein [Halocynthiibacter sp. SDUM655004]